MIVARDLAHGDPIAAVLGKQVLSRVEDRDSRVYIGARLGRPAALGGFGSGVGFVGHVRINLDPPPPLSSMCISATARS